MLLILFCCYILTFCLYVTAFDVTICVVICIAGLFLLAFVVVDSNNECNWCWLLEQLCEIVDNTRDLTITSDRNVGLMEAMPKVFPTVHHSCCLQHLKVNLRDKYSGGRFTHVFREHMAFLFTLCAYAPTEPLLVATRKVIPPLGGVDVTPVVWFGLISFLNEILVGPQGLLVLLSQQINQ